MARRLGRWPHLLGLAFHAWQLGRRLLWPGLGPLERVRDRPFDPVTQSACPRRCPAAEEINKRPDEYWTLVMDIARKNNLKRILRCTQAGAGAALRATGRRLPAVALMLWHVPLRWPAMPASKMLTACPYHVLALPLALPSIHAHLLLASPLFVPALLPADHGAQRERRPVGLPDLLPLHAGGRHLLPQGALLHVPSAAHGLPCWRVGVCCVSQPVA